MAETHPEQDAMLRKAAQDLLESISAEDVPDRIRQLALALGDALAGRKSAACPTPDKPSDSQKA